MKRISPNKINVGSITTSQLKEIANIKLPDLNTNKLESAIKIIHRDTIGQSVAKGQ